ncbi:cytochrome c [Flavobacterium sp. LMO8]|uniref:c-type cytochrome n=1 Tax=Flavobacterium sp. LMO8 TaxID=2654244 RepID=UPI001291872F|nr:cytochrome c [Flavobacterium sp. LMO8]MQP25774.1 cytochrome c [Flavobacterium sp. LMO8]
MKIKIIAIILLGTFIYSCSPKVVQTQAPKVDGVPLTPELAEGKVIFESKCAKCHDLYSPKDFNAEQWKPIMLSMQKKAKISDQEREKIYAYLTK